MLLKATDITSLHVVDSGMVFGWGMVVAKSVPKIATIDPGATPCEE
jgi:hypothetical protein